MHALTREVRRPAHDHVPCHLRRQRERKPVLALVRQLPVRVAQPLLAQPEVVELGVAAEVGGDGLAELLVEPLGVGRAELGDGLVPRGDERVVEVAEGADEGQEGRELVGVRVGWVVGHAGEVDGGLQRDGALPLDGVCPFFGSGQQRRQFPDILREIERKGFKRFEGMGETHLSVARTSQYSLLLRDASTASHSM